ncbi:MULTISPECIES: pilin N-terminal domain-containing protein [unclassified Enterococcus]|uniref:pilin N-terminal domain-containing protein n=1 Tax=unclassified Enterococcus TaxID=2608891 RepID=UPI001A9A94ED|nr:pilin N-terminal domain-containing protein [Enterococcus sp. DIV1271a]MBO1299613.1 hypothetical protein [Enterococcus sp. DIV1271a]
MKRLSNLRISIRSLLLLSVIFSNLLSYGFTSPVFADEGTYQLTVVKYKLSAKELDNGLLPSEPSDSLTTEVKGEDGRTLDPFAGISYRIVKVTPSNNKDDPFTEVEGFQPVEITTDASGQATVTLPKGLYEVTELSNKGLTVPAKPVVVELPMVTKEGNQIDHLFIYPKSSVVVPPTSTTPPGANPPGSNPPTSETTKTRIPQTSGNIGELWPVYLTLGFTLMIGLIGIMNFQPHKKVNKERRG